jgi:heme oxygenase
MNRGAEIREALKSSTQELHTQVDAAMGLHAPLHQLDGYGRFLGCMQGVHDAFGELSDRCSEAAGIEAQSGELRRLLRSDLAALGVAADSSTGQVAAGLSPWGIGYALEGSALGSTHLVKAVKASHDDAAPVQFLTASARGARERWPIFLGALGNAEVDVDNACQSARAVFDFILRTFQSSAVEGSEDLPSSHRSHR